MDAQLPPRAFSLRGVLIGLAIALFAVVMTAASVYIRRPQVEKTKQFLGAEAVQAVQLGTKFEIGLCVEGTPVDPADVAWTDLSGSPGLGLFRKALVSEGHFRWDLQESESLRSLKLTDPRYAIVKISGEIPDSPTSVAAPLEPVEILLELNSGWMGPLTGAGAVPFTDRVRPAIRNFIDTRKDSNRQHGN
ncbi:hypothetical protein SH139x_003436 [Planctomycetaceae bacterium SH139]